MTYILKIEIGQCSKINLKHDYYKTMQQKPILSTTYNLFCHNNNNNISMALTLWHYSMAP